MLIHNKYYLKEALLNKDSANEALTIIDQLIALFKNNTLVSYPTLNVNLQKVLYDFSVLLISLVQMVHLKMI